MKPSLLTLLTLLVYLIAQPTIAQDLDTVLIYGKVVDQNNASIPGAEIKVTFTKTAVERTTTTSEAGTYKLIQLEPGSYSLRVSALGFATQEIANLSFVSGHSQALDFTLVPAQVETGTVVITAADASLIDTRK